MTRIPRHLALLFGALALVVAPCAPAFATSPVCAMAGCDDSPFGSVSSPTCCCDAAGTPAQSGAQSSLTGSQAKAPASGVSPAAAPAATLASSLDETASAPRTPIPLFLLNSSFLI